MSNLHEGHRKRLKDRFLKTGLDSFEPHEILELLLFYARPRIDTNEFAHELIKKFGTLSGVFDADIKDIANVKGVGENGAVLIKMIPQLASAYSLSQTESDVMDTSKKVCNHFFNYFIGTKNEQLRVACLDDNLRIVASGVVIEGGLSSIPMNVRKIIEFTYRSGCEMIIIAHNHPNGLPAASEADIAVTNQINSILRNVGIKLLDHVIVNKDRATSMYDAGYFSTFK